MTRFWKAMILTAAIPPAMIVIGTLVDPVNKERAAAKAEMVVIHRAWDTRMLAGPETHVGQKLQVGDLPTFEIDPAGNLKDFIEPVRHILSAHERVQVIRVKRSYELKDDDDVYCDKILNVSLVQSLDHPSKSPAWIDNSMLDLPKLDYEEWLAGYRRTGVW